MKGKRKCGLYIYIYIYIYILYIMEYHLAIIKNAIMPFAAIWMNVENFKLVKSNSGEGQISYDIPYMWNLRKLYKWILYTTEINSDIKKKKNLWLPKGKEGRIEINIYITIYKINNKDLLYSTGNYIQYLAITYNGKKLKKNVYIYMRSESIICSVMFSFLQPYGL